MDINKLLTIIPASDAALHAVTTPFVAFEHDFDTRAAWAERQLEAFQRTTARVLLGDTWPDAHHDPMQWGRSSKVLQKYGTRSSRYDVRVWPETAIYHTGVAQLYNVDPTIHYRPQMHFFSQYIEPCSKQILEGDDVDMSPEAIIKVPDRNIYEVQYPVVKLPARECQLSIIAIGSPDLADRPADSQVVELSGDESLPTGARFNLALERAAGEYIAVAVEGYTNLPRRFEQQLEYASDLSIGAVNTGGGQELWTPYACMQYTDAPTGQLATMMFHRRVFERLGGACRDMSEGFGYDLFVRSLGEPDLSWTCHYKGLVRGEPYVCRSGKTYLQEVYNDVANRVRYTKGYHARSIQCK